MDRSKGGASNGERPIQLTREKAALCGLELKRLVRTRSFETVVEIMKAQLTAEVFNSFPHEKEAREAAYQRSLALDDLINTINSLIQVHEDDLLFNREGEPEFDFEDVTQGAY